MKKTKTLSPLKKRLYQAYYLLLTLILISQVVYTLYQTSFVVAYGQRQRQLQTRLDELTHQQQLAQQQLAEINSIQNLEAWAEEAGFELITQPISLKVEKSLASAQ